MEFARKPRGLHDISYWKATELRLFMLYIGIIVLKNVLPTKLYKHFMKLHIALRLLCTQNTDQINFAETLLKQFVASFGTLYGNEFISHNVHGLIHMSDDVRNLGPVDTYSAFPFENHLGQMKKLIRKGEKPLEQLSNRYAEIFSCGTAIDSPEVYPILKGQHNTGPELPTCEGSQYRKIVSEQFTISTKAPNNCCGLKDNSIVVVENVIHSHDGVYVIGRKYEMYNFYDNICESSLVETYKVEKLSSLMAWNSSELEKKYIMMPFNNSSVVMSLIHSQ